MLRQLPIRFVLICAAIGLSPCISADGDSVAMQRREHLSRLGVGRWHSQGQRGQGIKVAVLDTGFRGWRRFLGQGLPERVLTRSFRADGDLEARDSEHGILCAEVIHAVAPEAELLFANWDTDTPASFLAAVRWAKEQGARVLSCSVIMPSWSDGEGGGKVHVALDLLIGKELLFFASAGNIAQRHWSGDLRPAADGWHQWHGAVTANLLEPWGNERVAVELYGQLNGGTMQVLDAATGNIVVETDLAPPLGAQHACTQAVVRFEPAPRRDYQLRLKSSTSFSATPAKFHVAVLGANLEHSLASGSVAFPADGAKVVAVGAVDRRGLRAPYSSCGPNSRQPKPDFVAMVPFPSQCRERPFSGTSAAAPQAAGLAALCWSQHPARSAAQVHGALKAAAMDLGPVGHDCETGYGLVRLP